MDSIWYPLTATVLAIGALAWQRWMGATDIRPGDEVFVPVSSLPPNTVPIVRTGTVIVRADQLFSGRIQGPIVGYVVQELPTLLRLPLPAEAGTIVVEVPESAVTSVWRGGVKR